MKKRTEICAVNAWILLLVTGAVITSATLLGTTTAFAQEELAEEESAEESAEEKAKREAAELRNAELKALKQNGTGPELLNVAGLSKGVDGIIAEIRKREVGIALREQRVAERERSVVELEMMIEKRALELDRIRQEVEDRIGSWTAQGQDRVDQLSSVYASMPPLKAGDLLSRLDLDLAVSVVRSMKKKSSAGVLAAMRPDRALEVSRRLLKPLDPQTDSPAAPRK